MCSASIRRQLSLAPVVSLRISVIRLLLQILPPWLVSVPKCMNMLPSRPLFRLQFRLVSPVCSVVWLERPFTVTPVLPRLTLVGCTTLNALMPPSMLLRRTLDLRRKVPPLMTVPPNRIGKFDIRDMWWETFTTPWALMLAAKGTTLRCIPSVTIILLSVAPLVCLFNLPTAYLTRCVFVLIVVRSPVAVTFRLLR